KEWIDEPKWLLSNLLPRLLYETNSIHHHSSPLFVDIRATLRTAICETSGLESSNARLGLLLPPEVARRARVGSRRQGLSNARAREDKQRCSRNSPLRCGSRRQNNSSSRRPAHPARSLIADRHRSLRSESRRPQAVDLHQIRTRLAKQYARRLLGP